MRILRCAFAHVPERISCDDAPAWIRSCNPFPIHRTSPHLWLSDVDNSTCCAMRLAFVSRIAVRNCASPHSLSHHAWHHRRLARQHPAGGAGHVQRWRSRKPSRVSSSVPERREIAMYNSAAPVLFNFVIKLSHSVSKLSTHCSCMPG